MSYYANQIVKLSISYSLVFCALVFCAIKFEFSRLTFVLPLVAKKFIIHIGLLIALYISRYDLMAYKGTICMEGVLVS